MARALRSLTLVGRALLREQASGSKLTYQPTTFRAFASSTRASWWPSSSPPETAKEGGTSAAAGTEPAAAPAGEPATEAAASDLTPDELKQALQAAKEQLELAQKEAAESKDRLVRTLADMQNLRERTARQIADTKQFAVQGVVKSFIEVADNLDLAIGSVPEKELEGGEDVDVERALTLLKRLRDGVVMTESIMLKLLEKEGVRKYDPQGEPFDPNLHNAMFRVPNSGVKSGHVAHVIKKGYMLHERAVRAADVGVAE
ncbi:MGE1 [Auxenochlorella protothecoides x Auxenochlorella symbiontica]